MTESASGPAPTNPNYSIEEILAQIDPNADPNAIINTGLGELMAALAPLLLELSDSIKSLNLAAAELLPAIVDAKGNLSAIKASLVTSDSDIKNASSSKDLQKLGIKDGKKAVQRQIIDELSSRLSSMSDSQKEALKTLTDSVSNIQQLYQQIVNAWLRAYGAGMGK